MLVKCLDIEHDVKKLHHYVFEYLKAIEKLAATTPFNLNFFNKNWRTIIGVPSKPGAKKPNLRDLLERFHVAFLQLDLPTRSEFLKVFEETNNTKWVVNNPSKAKRLDMYPKTIQDITHDLFYHLYEDTLKKFDVKDHYKQVYKKLKNTWCPFCGMEQFVVYTRFKQDYDHLLCKSKYPVASVNMLNLVPLGVNCNRIHKKADDLLVDKKGNHRKAVNPYYDVIEPHISFSGSVLTEKAENRKWKVAITPNSEEVQTWDSVYNISSRCVEEFLGVVEGEALASEFDSLMRMFIKTSKDRRDIEGMDNWTNAKLDTELTIFRNGFRTNYYQEHNYLKFAAIDFVLKDPGASNYKTSLLRNINE